MGQLLSKLLQHQKAKMIIMSKSKDQTGNTPPLSSAEKTGNQAQPSEPLASSDNTQTYMQTTKMQSSPMLSGVTTDEKALQHAMLLRIALKALLKAGLIKRYEIRSADLTTVLKIRYEFDMSVWTEGLDLR